ncbi:MAG TPA: glycerol-3-phosphate dehydrogenase/oxidase [Verrucomicrobiae bacterium]|nr:glycerol-3-phosphate dehydrogenase/oxidase [Verrucomicrobiae bacterium]
MKSTPQARSFDRSEALRALATERFDLLIIGGGIVGAGIARDAALRGIKVALVDARDFAFGTSSRSSRLLHGGIRYLAQGRIGLVREASVEKGILHRIAPHLAEPLAFCFPAYRGTGWPLWQLRIGVKIYDALGGGRNFGKSQGMDATQALDVCPGLKKEGLRGAVRYFDGFTNDARLVIDTLRSAAKAGAVAVNYARFVAVERRSDESVCQLKDELGGSEFAVTARAVVNATGPWAEGLGLSKVKLRLTKGIHLVFDRARMPVGDAVVITQGARILFALPWGERTIVGTTDTDLAGRPEDARVEPADMEYVLASLNEFFPAAKLTTADVLSSYVGVRPLIASAKGKPSDISRTHSIRESAPGWWDVAGGKLTTYRLMAEQTVDAIARYLGGRFGQCVTAQRTLLEESETKGISQIAPPEISRELVEHFCRNEWARDVDDVMMRRTSWGLYRSDSAEVARQVQEWMAEH